MGLEKGMFCSSQGSATSTRHSGLGFRVGKQTEHERNTVQLEVSKRQERVEGHAR